LVNIAEAGQAADFKLGDRVTLALPKATSQPVLYDRSNSRIWV